MHGRVRGTCSCSGGGDYAADFRPFVDLPHPSPVCPPPGVPKLHVTYGGKELEHLRKDLRVVDYKRFSVLPVTQGRQYKTFERVEFGVRSVTVSAIPSQPLVVHMTGLCAVMG